MGIPVSDAKRAHCRILERDIMAKEIARFSREIATAPDQVQDWAPSHVVVDRIPAWMETRTPVREGDGTMAQIDAIWANATLPLRALSKGFLLLTYRWWWCLIILGTLLALVIVIRTTLP